MVVKTKPKGYSESFNHMVDHLRANRLTDRLQHAQRLNTSPESLLNWELGRNTPMVSFIANITHYLGYCPLLHTPKSLG